MEKNIYNILLHDEIWADEDTRVMRVAGGWIYTRYNLDQRSCVFVPYHEEFKEKSNEC